MHEDDEVCLCFHVSLRKLRAYIEREQPQVASLMSECLSAGTGCQWCVPFLKHLHTQHQTGKPIDLRVSPEQYMRERSEYREARRAAKEAAKEAARQAAEAAAASQAPPSA